MPLRFELDPAILALDRERELRSGTPEEVAGLALELPAARLGIRPPLTSLSHASASSVRLWLNQAEPFTVDGDLFPPAREIRIDAGPRCLLAAVKGLTLLEMEGAEQCCGFGGTFSVKFPELSTAMVRDKCRAIEATGADYVVSADASCLMHIGGWLSRNRSPVKPLHIADLLASSLDGG